MKAQHVLVAFLVSVDTLVALAKERLTTKQKTIIRHLEKESKDNITRQVMAIAEVLHCSRSAVWNNIRSLRRAGIITCGTAACKGKEVQLTPAGKMISEKLR